MPTEHDWVNDTWRKECLAAGLPPDSRYADVARAVLDRHAPDEYPGGLTYVDGYDFAMSVLKHLQAKGKTR